MEPATTPDGFEPTEWWVVFHPTATTRWLSWLAMGHFKHVSAFAYIPGFKAWLLYDVARAGTRLLLLPADARGKAELLRYTRSCSIVKMERQSNPPPLRLRPLLCTTAICHLLGLTCVARPDALWRLCLRNGGEVIGQPESSRPAIAGRPQPAN